MKRALIVIASVGILAVTVAMESANAQVTRPLYRPPPASPSLPPYTFQSPGWGRLGAPRNAPFSYPDLGAPRTAPLPDSPAATGGGSLGYNQFWKWKWW
jgi:hypothetical protein